MSQAIPGLVYYDFAPVTERARPSGFERLVPCPASRRLSEGVERSTSSEFTRPGTVAHMVAEMCGKQDRTPEEFVGTEFTVDGHKIIFDEEHATCVRTYLALIAGLKIQLEQQHGPGVEIFWEVDVKIDVLQAGMKGQIDCAIVHLAAGVAHIVDLKSGAGIRKDAIENPQGACYAIGAASRWPLTDVTFWISQDRPGAEHHLGPNRGWHLNQSSLDYYRTAFKAVAEETLQENPALEAGDHCRYCPAKLRCPLLTGLAHTPPPEIAPANAVVVMGEPGTPPTEGALCKNSSTKDTNAVTPLIATIDLGAASSLDLLAARARLAPLKMLRDEINKELLRRGKDHARAPGQCEAVPGKKIVQGTTALVYRSDKNEKAIYNSFQKLTACKKAEVHETKLLTAPKLRDFLKETNVPDEKKKAWMKAWFVKPDGRPVLVDETAKGREWKPSITAEEAFSAKPDATEGQ